METRTICCKLLTTPTMADALKETSERFSDACNHVLNIAFEEKTHNAIKLHKLCYTEIRKLFGLSANLAIRSIRRVVASITNLKGKRKSPKRFKPKSIDYDARIFSYRERDETVSLTTTKGRIRIPMVLGEHQRSALKGQNPTAATVINKEGVWYIHIVVDFGITNIVTASIGVTTTANHGLVSGDVVIFSSLYQTSTTGMAQICGIPFVVTVKGGKNE